MNLDRWLLVIQVAAVVTTLLAVAAALRLGREDRRAADRRADADLSARKDAQRRFDLERLVQLLIAVEAPHTSDPPDPVREHRNAKGAERRGLAAALGPDRMPVTWAALAKVPLDQLRAVVEQPPLQSGDPWEDSNARYNSASAEIVLELVRLRREVAETDVGRGPRGAH